MGLSIKIKLIISYVALSLFLISSILVVSNHMFEKHFQNYVKEVQEQKSIKLVNQVLDEFVKHEKPEVEFLYALGQSALDEGIIFMVSDKLGNELFCMSKTEYVESENMLDAMKMTMSQRYPNWQGEYTEVIYGLSRDNINYGKVTLGYYGPFYYTSQDIHFMNMLNDIIKYIAFAFSFIAILIGYYMAVKISNPIKALTKKAEQIKLGHYTERITLTSKTSEIDGLISSVNSLAESLQNEQAAKKRMANDYAHEFKTPLTTLQSNLEGMIDGILAFSPERLESCRGEVLRLSRMVSEIDKITTLENTPLHLNKETFDLKSLLQQLTLNFESQMVQKNIKINTSYETIHIFADKDKMSQVFINLLSNAIKYTECNGSIFVSLEEKRGVVRLRIKDTGIGISKEDLPYIFDNLFRVDKARARNTGGSGIGLSVVKAIVNAHQGRIEVNSSVGEGSEFIVIVKSC